jgi:hypothetical protein
MSLDVADFVFWPLRHLHAFMRSNHHCLVSTTPLAQYTQDGAWQLYEITPIDWLCIQRVHHKVTFHVNDKVCRHGDRHDVSQR